MRTRDIADLLFLGSLWGASFLFMRIAAPEFGPMAMVEMRVAIAAAALVPVYLASRRDRSVDGKLGPIVAIGLINSTAPFCLLAYATIHVPSGFAAILNATSPAWGALIAYLWLKDRLTVGRIIGLILGITGVVVLVWNKFSFGEGGSALAILAALGATLLYGFGANYTKRYLHGVDTIAASTLSLLVAAVVLAPFAVVTWPSQAVSLKAWASVAGLGVLCTAMAYIFYFRLVTHVGPARAIAVTFLVPVFAVVWGAIFLDEQITPNMIAGGAVILLGTALSTGVLRIPARSVQPVLSTRD